MADAKVALIDLQPRAITLKPGREPGFFEGSFSLSLSNARGVPFAARIEIRPEGEAKAAWISIPEERVLFDFPADKTEPIPISVRVPESAAGKKLAVTVKVMDKANPDELYDTQGAEMIVPAVTHQPPPKMPVWLIPLIVGAVLVLGGGIFAILKLTGGPKLGQFCDPGAPKCPDGVTCDPVKKQCLAKLTEGCKHDQDCVTGHCTGDKCGPLAIGESCDPAASLCGDDATCSPGKTCLANQGKGCSQNGDCITGSCGADKKCALLALHAPCDPQRAFCAEGLDCADTKKCLALLKQHCNQPGDCITNNCANQQCAPTAMKAGDPCQGDCGAPLLACVSGVCKGAINASCAKDTDCQQDLVCSQTTCQPTGLEMDTNRPGQDYTDFDMATGDPLLCRGVCEADARCQAFTYAKPNSVRGPKPHCWLKTGMPSTVTNICCVSGTVVRIRGLPYSVMSNPTERSRFQRVFRP